MTTDKTLGRRIVRGRRAATLLALLGALLVVPMQLQPAAGLCAAPGHPPTSSTPVDAVAAEAPGLSLEVEHTSIRWTRWHNRVVFGDSTTLEGQVVTEGGAVAEAAVDLFAREAGAAGWTRVGSAVSDAETGVFAFTCLRPAATTEYRATYEGSLYYAGSQGGKRVQVARRVPDTMRRLAGERFRLEGTVRPRYAGRPVLMQSRSCPDCTWRTVARHETTSRSRWGFAIDASTFAGQRWFRVVAPGDDRYVRSYSERDWCITSR